MWGGLARDKSQRREGGEAVEERTEEEAMAEEAAAAEEAMGMDVTMV